MKLNEKINFFIGEGSEDYMEKLFLESCGCIMYDCDNGYCDYDCYSPDDYQFFLFNFGNHMERDEAVSEIEKLLNMFESSEYRLYLTSYNYYIRNYIPLKYWNVLIKQNDITNIYNYQNSKDIWDSWSYVGFGNVDFFNSNYISQYIEHQRQP